MLFYSISIPFFYIWLLKNLSIILTEWNKDLSVNFSVSDTSFNQSIISDLTSWYEFEIFMFSSGLYDFWWQREYIDLRISELNILFISEYLFLLLITNAPLLGKKAPHILQFAKWASPILSYWCKHVNSEFIYFILIILFLFSFIKLIQIIFRT